MDLKEIFNDDVIKHFRDHKEEITHELLQELRSHGNEGKELALQILDTPMDDEEYHLDAFGHRISFNGDRFLKKPHTKMNLSQIHLDEIKRCSEDIEYFKDNYVKIKTKSGVNFPDLRDYQNDFIKMLSDDNKESVVAMMPRQCLHPDTLIDLDGEKVTIYDAFHQFPNTEFNKNDILEIADCSGYNVHVRTPIGYLKVKSFLKIEPKLLVEILLDNGMRLKCAELHTLITENNEEIHAKDCLGVNLITSDGIAKVVWVKEYGYKEDMFDVEIEPSENYHLYFANDILSHNSGKTSTTAIFLAHKYVFGFDITIGILANKGDTAKEFLTTTKDIFQALPIWMQTGTKIWNVKRIANENNCRIIVDVPSDASFRGLSVNLLVVDEAAWIPTTKYDTAMDALLPSQGALAWKKNIFLSTPHGINHFTTLVNGAKKPKVLKEVEPDEIVLMPDGTKKTLQEVYEEYFLPKANNAGEYA
jgi:hypothetical protein